MQHRALVRPADEWQVREWCRTGLRSLLNAIGSDTFESALLAYLYLVVRADRVATAWTSPDELPRIDSFGDDEGYCKVVAGQLDRVLPTSEVVLVESDRHADCHLASMGLAQEMRLVIELGAGRRFAAFLGRLATSQPWSKDEVDLAGRSLSLLQSVIVAHDRCLAFPQPPRPVQISAERRLVRAFEQRGLSLRESEIASKILFGYSTLAIAMDLGISENTVKVHRKHLNQKLGVRSQAELFGFAYKALMDGEPL